MNAVDISHWLRTNRFHHTDFTIAGLAQTVRHKNLHITVIIPAKEVAATIGAVLQQTVQPLVTAGVVSRVVVIDAASRDGTADVARAAGAEVLQREDIAATLGRSRGKGDAMWRALLATDGAVVAFLDGDTQDASAAHLVGILGPVVTDERIALVKGCFARPFRDAGGELRAHEGGRVTELLARPLLNRYWPGLGGMRQPLAGEFAARRELLEQLGFPVGYGVELGTLVEAYERVGLEALAEVDVGQRLNAHQPLRELTMMAGAILATAERRRGGGGRESRMYLPWVEEYRDIDATERPPVSEYRVYPSPPFWAVEGVRMLRDVGASSGGLMRRGLVFRSGELARLTASGLARLRELGVKKVFDLRSPGEIEQGQEIHGDGAGGLGEIYPHRLREAGLERVVASVFPDEAWHQDARAARLEHYANAAEGYAEAYLQTLQYGVNAFVPILQHLAQPDPPPILLHCTAGKDRTGVTAMLVLLLAGCDDDTIADEYALNDLDSKRAWGVDATNRLLSQPGLRGNVGAVENVVRAQKAYMLATLGRFRKEYGSVETYVKRVLKLDGSTVRAIRASLAELPN